MHPFGADIAAAIDAAKKKWGRLDIMINNAGAFRSGVGRCAFPPDDGPPYYYVAGISGGSGYEFPLNQSRASWMKYESTTLASFDDLRLPLLFVDAHSD